VLGVSKDSVKSHCGFRDKHGLTIELLSDPDLALHRAYGTFGEKMMYGRKIQGTIRTTFILDEDGKIARVFPNVKVDGHADAVLNALVELARGSHDSRSTSPSSKVATANTAGARNCGHEESRQGDQDGRDDDDVGSYGQRDNPTRVTTPVMQ